MNIFASDMLTEIKLNEADMLNLTLAYKCIRIKTTSNKIARMQLSHIPSYHEK